MCDRFYLHGQTGDRDNVGSTIQSSHPAWPWSPNQTGPLWLIRLCRSRCHLACCWLQQAFVFLHWLFQLAIHGSACLGFLTAASCSRAWTQLDVFPSPLLGWAVRETAHMMDWLFCLAHPWLTSCQPTPRFFFHSVVEWILGILHRIEIRFDLLHLMSCFYGWQVQ